MATPKIGIVVQFHEYGTIVPAMVVADHSTWSSEMFGWSDGTAQPDSGTIMIAAFDATTPTYYTDVAEGTGDGEYSLIPLL